MKVANIRITALLALFVGVMGIAQGQIMSEEARAQKLEVSRNLLNRNVALVEKELIAKAPNPFSRGLGIAVEVVVEEVEAISGDELIKELGRQINPTGVFMFNGEYLLIFRERRARVGDMIPVMYQGEQYQIIISEISSASYKIQYDGLELQQKLK